jgi:uncharacterized protein
LDDKYSLQNQRIFEIDALRGFALLGILIINIIAFSWPVIYTQALNQSVSLNSFSLMTENVVQWFVQGKFYTLFALLFGISFYLFLQKNTRKIGLRRSSILMFFGICHAFLLWWGDILIIYSLCGILLLFISKMSNVKMFFSAILLYLIFALFMFLLVPSQIPASISNHYERMYDQSLEVYSKGSFEDLFNQRILDWFLLSQNIVLSPFVILPLFILGYIAIASGFLQKLLSNHNMLMKTIVLSGFLGITLTTIKEYTASKKMNTEFTFYDFFHLTFGWLADLFLAVFYGTLIIVMIKKKWFQTFFQLCHLAGKMSLSHYLFQSIACNLIFYSYGLGLYGKLDIPTLVIISFGIFTLQLYMSKWWLHKFKIGPAEKLWRKWLYV